MRTVLRIKTGICKVNGGPNPFLAYCGYSLEELVIKQSSFELVAYLLLHNQLPDDVALTNFSTQLKNQDNHLGFLKPIIQAASVPGVVATELSASLGMSRLSTLTTMLNTAHSWSDDQSCALDLLATLPVAILAWHYFDEDGHWDRFNAVYEQAILQESYSARFIHLLRGAAPSEAEIKAYNGVLNCYAEHGFNASTTAACASISTQAPLALAISSAINTLIGSLHGGANLDASKLILQFNSIDDIEPWVRQFFIEDDQNKAEGEPRKKLHGFGHAVYKYFDPRVPIIKKLIKELLDSDPERISLNGESISAIFAMAECLDACVKNEFTARDKSLPVNVDFYMAILLEALHIPQYLFTVTFALGRMAGWIAHCIEYKETGSLIRLKDGLSIEIEYVGRLLKKDDVDLSAGTQLFPADDARVVAVTTTTEEAARMS